jgi:hypothetical protein
MTWVCMSLNGGRANLVKQLAVLGYSCGADNFVFNFTSSPAARKIISDFIATNVKVGHWVNPTDKRHVKYGIHAMIARVLQLRSPI